MVHGAWCNAPAQHIVGPLVGEVDSETHHIHSPPEDHNEKRMHTDSHRKRNPVITSEGPGTSTE